MVAIKFLLIIMKNTGAMLSAIAGSLKPLIATTISLPYYRFYRQNTLLPILAIARCVENNESDEVISGRLRHWQDRKLAELKFTAASATLLAAAVIGCFSWPAPATMSWFGPASWYSSLVLSLFSVLLSSAEGFVFATLRNSPRKRRPEEDLTMIITYKQHYVDHQPHTQLRPGSPTPEAGTELPTRQGSRAQNPPVRVEVRWNMIFTWQAPVMLMSYSFLLFIMGLTTFVITPLYDGRNFDAESKVAIFYIVIFCVGVVVFIWSAYWAYRFVDLDGE